MEREMVFPKKRLVFLSLFFIASLFPSSSEAVTFFQYPTVWENIGIHFYDYLISDAHYYDDPLFAGIHQDAFDGWGAIRIDALAQQWTSYSIDYNSAYYAVVSGPAQGASGLTVNVILRLTNGGWAVGLNEMSNPTGSPISVSISNPLAYGASNWDLGSDLTTQIYDSSSGNPAISAADSWFTTWPGGILSDPMVTTSFGPYMDSISLSTDLIYFNDVVTVPAGATVSFLWVTRISDPHQRAVQIPYISTIIDDINQLYSYGLLDHLSPAQISNVYNFNTFVGGGGGDPHILGMDGNVFDIVAPHGKSMDGTVVNLFSDLTVQLNAKIGSPAIRQQFHYFHSMALTLFSSENRVKLLVDASINLEQRIQIGVESDQSTTLASPHVSLQTQSSPSTSIDLEAGFDEVFGQYRIQVVDRNDEKFSSGEFEIPSISRFDNSNAILKIAVTPSSSERDAYHHQHSFLFVVHQDQHQISPSTNGRVDWVKYGTELVPMEIQEEQQGEFGVALHRRIDVYVRSPGRSEPHGYIGQSHPGSKQYRREWERWQPLEGEHMDYVLQSGELFGSDFHFNKFALKK